MRFLNLYRNPFLSNAEICRRLEISLATFYRYEKELNYPVLRVGLANSKGPFIPAAVEHFALGLERFEAGVLQAMGAMLPFRLKPVALDFGIGIAEKALRTEKIDLAFSSISWTKERAQEFYFSHGYGTYDLPHGNLISLNCAGHSLLPSKSRPLLAVPAKSVHADYALSNLTGEFLVKVYASVALTLNAVVNQSVDAALLHPAWVDLFYTDRSMFHVSPKSYFYQSYTGILFNPNAVDWRQPFNSVIERMHDSGELGELERGYDPDTQMQTTRP